MNCIIFQKHEQVKGTKTLKSLALPTNFLCVRIYGQNRKPNAYRSHSNKAQVSKMSDGTGSKETTCHKDCSLCICICVCVRVCGCECV